MNPMTGRGRSRITAGISAGISGKQSHRAPGIGAGHYAACARSALIAVGRCGHRVGSRGQIQRPVGVTGPGGGAVAAFGSGAFAEIEREVPRAGPDATDEDKAFAIKAGTKACELGEWNEWLPIAQLGLAHGEMENYAEGIRLLELAQKAGRLFRKQSAAEKRRLLGALEAANGVLMFALTTGFLYTILSGVLERYWDEQIGQKSESKG